MAEPRPDQPPTTPEPAEGRARRGLGAWLARAGGELPFASRLDDRVREDLWSRFANEAASVELAHVVLGVLVGAILLGRAPWLPVAGWLAAVVTVTGARLMIRRRAAQGAGRALDSRWRIRWAVVAGAMVWGALPLLLLPYLGVVDLLLLMVILAGMVAAATATLVSDPVSFQVDPAAAGSTWKRRS